jgi:hypothetical protein
MKSYSTQAKALNRQAYLFRYLGIMSGVQRQGERWAVLYDPIEDDSD